MILPRPQRPQRTDIHDVSAIALQHHARRSLAGEKHRLQIHIVNEIPILLFNLQRIEFVKRAALFTTPSSRPKCCATAIDHRANLADIFQIRLENCRVPAFRRRLPRLRFRSVVVDRNPRAIRRQRQRNRAADPLRRRP